MHGVIHRCYQNETGQSAMMAATLFLHRFLRTWRNKVAAYIALSAFSRKKFIEAGLPSKKITIIPNGIAPTLERRIRLDPKSASLVYLGRLSEEKGIKVLLDGYIKFASNMSVPLEIIGDGPLMPYVRDVQSRVPHLNIRAHGFLVGEAKEDVLRRAAYLIFPSECYENCPFSLLEAMSMGIPVIGSDSGGLPEVIADGESGRLFKAGSGDDLCRALTETFRDGERDRLSEGAFERIRSGYGLNAWIDRTIDLYGCVLTGEVNGAFPFGNVVR